MRPVGEVRDLIADALTLAGVICLPYPPDTAGLPIAFLDAVQLDFAEPGTFCGTTTMKSSLMHLCARNDMSGGLDILEGSIGKVVETVEGITGLDVSVTGAMSGTTSLDGADVLAVTYDLVITL